MMEPTSAYTPSPTRYDTMTYNRCGSSGLKLPAISLGCWHNFGDHTPFETMRQLTRTAFDHGITHFDLANNYGPEPGSAERNVGQLLRTDFAAHRDELIISTKAGYEMWPGPYGDLGSRKYLIASLDQSLKRLGLDYVDIFYHHRMDPETPLEETMGALAQIVASGKALYVGLSNYDGPTLEKAAAILFAGYPGTGGDDALADRAQGDLAAPGSGADHLLPARPGPADRPLSRRRHPLRQPYRHRRPLPACRRADRGQTQADPRPEQHRGHARPDAGRDGAGLAAA